MYHITYSGHGQKDEREVTNMASDSASDPMATSSAFTYVDTTFPVDHMASDSATDPMAMDPTSSATHMGPASPHPYTASPHPYYTASTRGAPHMGSASAAMNPTTSATHMGPTSPPYHTASTWGVPYVGSFSAAMNPTTSITPMNTTLATGPSGFNDRLSYGHQYGGEAFGYGNTMSGDAFNPYGGSYAEYSPPAYFHSMLSSSTPRVAEDVAPMGYDHMHGSDEEKVVDSVEGEGSEEMWEDELSPDSQEDPSANSHRGVKRGHSTIDNSSGASRGGRQAKRGAGSSRRTRTPIRRVPAVLPRTATAGRSKAGQKVNVSGGITKLNKDGSLRKTRAPRGPLVKWAEREVLERALVGLVLAAYEDSLEINFGKAGKSLGATGPAFQQAVGKIHKKLRRAGYDLPDLHMSWEKKRPLVKVTKGKGTLDIAIRGRFDLKERDEAEE